MKQETKRLILTPLGTLVKRSGVINDSNAID